MVNVAAKPVSRRLAKAKGSIVFSNSRVIDLISQNNLKKGDVLSVARIAGIMGAKKTSDLIPLCHPLVINSIQCDLSLGRASVNVECTVECDGKTGVEMEALCGTMVGLATIYDMCKAVDKHMRIENVRVVEKRGGASGDWVESENPPDTASD